MNKLRYLFNTRQQRILAFILCSLALTGLVEMISVAAIFPFMAVLSKPSIIQSNSYFQMLYQTLQFSEPRYFIIFLGSAVVSCLVFGNIFSAFVSWLTLRFCYRQGERLSVELLKRYLSQPYQFYLFRHSSELARNVINEVDRVVSGILVNGLQSFAKIVVVICILTLLCIVDFRLALVILLVLGGAYTLTYIAIRATLARSGKVASQANATRLHLIHDVIGAIKEIKVLQRENHFIDYYQISAKDYANAETRSQLSLFFTRYVIEAIAFGGMLLITIYLIARGADMTKFIPLLGLYALAGYRLMPALQQLFQGFSLYKYHSAALDTICEEFTLTQNKMVFESKPLPFQDSVLLQNVSFRYPNATKASLQAINMVIKRNATIGIVGPSGSGKTTLMDVLLGLLPISSGSLHIDDTLLTEENIPSWQKQMGYVPQSIFLIDASIAENIALGIEKDKIDLVAVKRAAMLANLHDFIEDELEAGYNTKVGERGVRLSGGQRQRIGIARALYHDPNILIFDEATSALDGITEKVIMEAIKALNHTKTIILVAHRLNTVKNCDYLYLMSQGEIIGQGNYDELLSTNKAFQKLALINDESRERVLQ